MGYFLNAGNVVVVQCLACWSLIRHLVSRDTHRVGGLRLGCSCLVIFYRLTIITNSNNGDDDDDDDDMKLWVGWGGGACNGLTSFFNIASHDWKPGALSIYVEKTVTIFHQMEQCTWKELFHCGIKWNGSFHW